MLDAIFFIDIYYNELVHKIFNNITMHFSKYLFVSLNVYFPF